MGAHIMAWTQMIAIVVVLAGVCSATNVCPGEGSRYGDHKCTHDPTHRVCAKLKNQDGSKLMWGGSDFWGITQQPDWSSEVGKDSANPGGDWCICMWATASLIKKAGCDNVHLDCGATDVSYVMSKYTDGGTDLAPAKSCLKSKCGASLARATEVRSLSSDR